jgi:aminopeptidase N
LQAGASRDGTLDAIEALGTHPDFNIKRPNRVRALYGTLAYNNPRHFHDATGRGYVLLKDLIKRLDGINPQVAARLLSSFEDWRRLEPKRRAMAQEILEDLAGEGDLSPNSYEIVTKTLGQPSA